MKSKENFSHEEWILLGLAGAFNTEQDRWSIRKASGGWQVIRQLEDPSAVEVKAHYPTNGEAYQAKMDMADIAAAKAFTAELSKLLEE